MIPFEAATAVGANIDLSREWTTAVLRTIADGWVIAQQYGDLTTDAKEVAITKRLCDGMRRAAKILKLKMLIARGTESYSAPTLTEPDGRTDIPIFIIEILLRDEDHEPHAIVECKRLKETDSGLIREYVVEGIDRFRTGKYAGSHGSGFMTGYLQGGTAKGAVSKINAYLATKRRSAEELAASGTFRSMRIWTSKHPRSGRPNIMLYHSMLLTLPASPNARGASQPGAGLRN